MSLPVNQDQNIFKADEEVKNSTSTIIPECIQSLPQSQPSSPDLTNEETSKALKSLLQKDYIQLDFPKRTKFRVDPHLPGQSFALISFIPSRNARPDSQGCFGVLKVRGTFPNMNEAERWAENLVRGYDSYSEIDITYVGKDFPIMADNSMYCESTREIDVRKKIEDTVKENIKQKKEEEKKAKTVYNPNQYTLPNYNNGQFSKNKIPSSDFVITAVKAGENSHTGFSVYNALDVETFINWQYVMSTNSTYHAILDIMERKIAECTGSTDFVRNFIFKCLTSLINYLKYCGFTVNDNIETQVKAYLKEYYDI